MLEKLSCGDPSSSELKILEIFHNKHLILLRSEVRGPNGTTHQWNEKMCLDFVYC